MWGNAMAKSYQPPETNLGVTLDKEMQTADWSGELSDAHLEYAARDAELTSRGQFEQADKTRNDTRVEYTECKGTLVRAEQDIARLRTDCGHVYAELPGEERKRVSPAPPADWLATSWRR